MDSNKLPSCCDLSPYLTFLKVEGEGVFRFLNNLTTNDVLGLANYQGQVNLLVDRQAKIKFIFWNYKVDDGLLVLIEKNSSGDLMRFLKENVFLEKITISPLSDFIPLALFNPADLKKLIDNYEESELESIKTDQLLKKKAAFVIKTNFTFYNDFIVLIKKDNFSAINPVKETDFFDSLVFEKSKWLRLEDMDNHPSILETHFYEQAVSFEKGCYPGQEVITKFRSKKRKLFKKIVMLSLTRESLSPLPQKKAIQYDEKKILAIFKVKNSPTFKKTFMLASINRHYLNDSNEVSLKGDKQKIEVLSLPIKKTSEFEEHYDLGLKHFHENRITEAKTNFEKAIFLKKDYEMALEGLALCEEKLKNFPRAIEINKNIAQKNPSAIMPHTNLSRLYMLSGLINEAEEENKKATVLMFKQSSLKKTTDDLEKEKSKVSAKTNRQIAFYKKILLEEPNDDIAHFQLGKIHYESQEYEKARKYFEKVIVINEKYSLAYYYLGTIFIELGNKRLAKNFLNQGVAVAKENGDFAPLRKIENELKGMQ